jgi:hypothetical protein
MTQVRDAARRMIAGELTEREFVEWVHCHVGHDGPDDLQDIVEMDDEYDPNIDSNAANRFIHEGKPAQVRAFAEDLVAGLE